jgi:predicted ATPase
MIKHVRITNFKSLGDVSFDLEPVTVLIGRSGTGKSNFFDAMRFLRDCVKSLNGVIASNNQGGWARIIPATAPGPVSVSFSVRFGSPGLAEDYEYVLLFQPSPHGQQQIREEKLSLGGRGLFHNNLGKWVQAPPVVNPPAPNTGTLVLGAVTGVREISRAHSLLSNGLAFYAFPDQVLLSTPPNPDQTQTGLTIRGENFLQMLVAIDVDPQAWDYQQEMIAALRQLNPSIKSVELNMPGREKVVVSHQVGDRLLPLELIYESEGFRRLLAHLIALYQTPPKQTLFFEEPEKGIHPGALAMLADEFKACPDAGRGQIILTSHSPELLDHFEPEQLRVVEMDNYLTKIGPVAPEQVDAIRQQLLHPGELITVDAARLAASPSEGQ